MCSPLAPVLAKIFMFFYKFKWLDEYNFSKPKFYLRYVDDILAAFDKEQDSLSDCNGTRTHNHLVVHLGCSLEGLFLRKFLLSKYFKFYGFKNFINPLLLSTFSRTK